MSSKHEPITFRGRSIGIIILTIAQLFIGAIHVFFGLLLMSLEGALTALTIPAQAPLIYDVYTIVFGLLVFIFAILFWLGKRFGWVGTVAVSLFVIVADALTLFDLPSIPGIPKFAALTEITYSLLVVFYLSQAHIRRKYLS